MQVKFCALALLVAIASATSDVLLKPVTESGIDAAIVLVQGAQIPVDRYVPLLTAMQQGSNLRLWAAAPEMALSTPEPLVLAGGLDRSVSALRAAGLPSNAPIYYAGHSLGGAMLQDYMSTNADKADAQILMRSFLQRKHLNQSTPYPTPTLTIGGELDGLCRVARIAEAFYHQVHTAPSSFQAGSLAATGNPVVVLDGVSHMQFASGAPPTLVQQRDLLPELADEAAHAAIAAVAAAYMEARAGGSSSAAAAVEAAVTRTGTLVAPLLEAMEAEHSYHIKKPCYDDAHTDACQTGNAWTETVSQQVMGDLTQGGKLDVIDEFHQVWKIPVHLPKVDNNCTTEAGCVLQVHTVTQNVYDKLDDLDTGFAAVSASEIRTKMASRQKIQFSAGHLDADFNVTDSPDICQAINQRSLDWAAAKVGSKTAARFQKLGEPIVLAGDLGPYNAGPLWIWDPLSMKHQRDASGNTYLEVRSPMMRTPLDYKIQFSAGFHYCKVLSPFRVMEWYYTDGLRAHASLNSHTSSLRGAAPAGDAFSVWA